MLLHIARPPVLIVVGQPLLWARVVPDTARTATERHMAVPGDKPALHNRMIFINAAAPSATHAHMHHRRVVGEDPSPPQAARKSNTTVAKPVVHTAVVAHMRSPISTMKNK
jgi:hypothetical protein